MTPYELMDLTLSLSNRIDNHWTLFITVHLALIGGIIYVDRPLSIREKTLAFFVYSGFGVINYFMMIGQAHFLMSIYQQIYTLHDLPCCSDNHVIKHVVHLYDQDNRGMLSFSIKAVHITMYIIVSLSIFYDAALPKKRIVEESD